MRLMLDLNVLLDVVQRREPFYAASASLLSRALDHEMEGYLPGHALTTLHYIVNRSAGRKEADDLVDWLLAHLEIVAQDKLQFVRARNLAFHDSEDAVVASAAEASRCDLIATRNVADFEGSPVPAVTPEEFLARSIS
jgi:predicted nucleic acid-binding protein